MDVGTHPLNLAVWGESWGSAQDQRGPRGARRQGAVTVPARDSGSLPQAPHVPLCFFCKNDECSFRSPECLLPHPPRMFLVPKALLGLRSPGTRRLCHPPTHSPYSRRLSRCSYFFHFLPGFSSSNILISSAMCTFLLHTVHHATFHIIIDP